jgi:hypothetical protein
METYDTLKEDDVFEKFSMDCIQIQEFQQNRYPYLFLDHVDEIVPGKYAKGFKNYTIYFVPDNFTPNVVYDNNYIPIIDISQIDTFAEKWKKSHYNWFEIFNSPLHNY